MISLNQSLSPNSDAVVAEVIDGEAVLIDLSTGVYHSMDGVGGSVWSLIEVGTRLEEIVGAITARYEVSREQAEADVQRIAADLVQAKLVVTSDGEPSGRPDHESAAEPKLPYDPPELKTYRDMSDLLALDPPTPGMRDVPWKWPD
jgi:hypothetical protein